MIFNRHNDPRLNALLTSLFTEVLIAETIRFPLGQQEHLTLTRFLNAFRLPNPPDQDRRHHRRAVEALLSHAAKPDTPELDTSPKQAPRTSSGSAQGARELPSELVRHEYHEVGTQDGASQQELAATGLFSRRASPPSAVSSKLGKRAEPRGGKFPALLGKHSDEGDNERAGPRPAKRFRSSLDNPQGRLRYYRIIGQRDGRLVAQLRTGERAFHFGYPAPTLDEAFHLAPWTAWQRLTPASTYDLVPVRAFPHPETPMPQPDEVSGLLQEIQRHVELSVEEEVNVRRFLLAFRRPYPRPPPPTPRLVKRGPARHPTSRLAKRGHAMHPPGRRHRRGAPRQRWIRVVGQGRDGRVLVELHLVDGDRSQTLRHPHHQGDERAFQRALDRRFHAPHASWHSLTVAGGALARVDASFAPPDMRPERAIPFAQQHELGAWIRDLRLRGRLDDMEVSLAHTFILEYRLPAPPRAGRVERIAE